MVDTRRLSGLTESALRRLRLPDGPMAIGLSGGADSGALAYLCRRLGRETRAIHINHGLRDSMLMEGAARSVADNLEIDLEVRTVTVPSGASPEGQARNVRYLAFEEATGPEEALLTAHTLDDDVETILFNIVRGTGPGGLTGIPYLRPDNVYRPILEVSRSETREIATLAGLPYIDDPMNDDLDLARNFIRSRLLPLMTELNPRLATAMKRLARAVANDNEYLDSRAAMVHKIHTENSAGVAVGDLVGLPKAVRDRVLKDMLVGMAGNGAVAAETIAAMWEVANGTVARAQLSSELTVERRGPMLMIASAGDPAPSFAGALTPGRHRHGSRVFEVLQFDRICQVAPLSRWSAIFPKDTLLEVTSDGVVAANGEPAWAPGSKRFPVAWYEPGSVGYLSVFAREEDGWISNP
ncbi:MAG: tRNA lysidine(34) synthetase TilS [Acidimicrobiia bacterium]